MSKTYLADVSIGALEHWSIQSKRRQDKFSRSSCLLGERLSFHATKLIAFYPPSMAVSYACIQRGAYVIAHHNIYWVHFGSYWQGDAFTLSSPLPRPPLTMCIQPQSLATYGIMSMAFNNTYILFVDEIQNANNICIDV